MEDIVKEMELSVKDDGNVEIVKKADAGGDDIIALEAAKGANN